MREGKSAKRTNRCFVLSQDVILETMGGGLSAGLLVGIRNRQRCKQGVTLLTGFYSMLADK